MCELQKNDERKKILFNRPPLNMNDCMNELELTHQHEINGLKCQVVLFYHSSLPRFLTFKRNTSAITTSDFTTITPAIITTIGTASKPYKAV